MLRISIVNGPNLNLLGTREPAIYGNQYFESYVEDLKEMFPTVSIGYFQSNVEGELINALHNAIGTADAVILNAGGYTHTSIAIADAVTAINLPVMEVHISNVYAREEYRKTSYIAAKCIGGITGLGLQGYALAIQYFQSKLTPETP
jgi:3-dehydroquinate dehydratase-2